MIDNIRADAEEIVAKSIRAVLPENAVKEALAHRHFTGEVYLVAIGKAAFTMAKAAKEVLGEYISAGVVVTKYGHAQGYLEGIRIIEAGHPVPDSNSVKGAQAILEMTTNLTASDEVLFLVSGGGSALFEKPTDGLKLEDLVYVTDVLLRCGADITEINTLRKRLSAVKGGRFAEHCAPARVCSLILSDVLGDKPDAIASGPAWPDSSTAEDAQNIIQKYSLSFIPDIIEKLRTETPENLYNVEATIIGSVSILCRAAADAAAELGYFPYVLTSGLNCEAREAGRFLANIACEIGQWGSFKRPCALVVGGETVVTVRGNGKGGRNQELVLAAAELIAGLENTVIFSVGSDGTDGPTDAAGGIVDGGTKQALLSRGVRISDVLANNDAYNALRCIDGLIITGPTGTNVNDITVILSK